MSAKPLAIVAGITLILAPVGALTAVAALVSPVIAACAPAPLPSGEFGDPDIPETTAIVMPVPSGTYVITDGFGPRLDPFTGEPSYHYGTDFAAADGTPILAAADGVVRIAGVVAGRGPLIVIEHTVDGQRVATLYLHMWEPDLFVSPGQQVSAGQQISEVGSEGYSTGAHLHFEVHPGGWPAPAVDSLRWLVDHGAISIEDAGLAGCRAGRPSPTPSVISP